MTPNDKQRIKDAFNKAMQRDPKGADEPFMLEGLATPLTSREVLNNTLNSQQFYEGIEKAITSGQRTLDQFVADFEKIKLPLVRKAPKP